MADPFNSRRFQTLYGRVPEIIPYGIDGYFAQGDGAAARARFGLESGSPCSRWACSLR